MSLLLLGTRAARADVASCAQAHASGQHEAKSGHPKAAAQLFASCLASEGCPEAIRAECLEFARDNEKSLPTVIFAVSDAKGKDLVDVRVYSADDPSAADELLAEKLDGRAVAIDPGEHHFKFVLASGDPISSDVLVREGEKNRIVSVHVPAPVTRAPAAPLEQDQPSSHSSSLSPAFWISSGVAAAALTSFTVFSLLGHSRQSQLSDCSPGCAPSRRDDFDAMHRDYLIGDLSLGVALVSAGAATWFLLSGQHPKGAPDQARSFGFSKRVAVLPLSSAAGFSVSVNTD
ncbi:MAG: hypothetical protein ABW061_08030 [Polyangiaceae bacterium]